MNPNDIPDLTEFKDSMEIQLRFNDVDVLGHVNNSVYFTYYDTGKAHYFGRVTGEKIDWKNVGTVIANIDCAFVEPIFYGERIELLTRCASIHDKSFRLQQVLREKTTGRIKSIAETVMVCYNPRTRTTCEVSAEWRGALERMEGRDLSGKG